MSIKTNHKIIDRKMFLDEQAGTVTVQLQLEPRTANEQPVKLSANHVREWLLQEKGVVAGYKIAGQTLTNNLAYSRFGL